MARRDILMVSADAGSSVALHEQFRDAGYDVKFAQNADEALTIARRDLPQAIVMDTDVPGLDVAALANDLRSTPRTRHIHLTLLAPIAGRDARLAALSAGSTSKNWNCASAMRCAALPTRISSIR
jgi:CheY-like chemotaxis protein